MCPGEVCLHCCSITWPWISNTRPTQRRLSSDRLPWSAPDFLKCTMEIQTIQAYKNINDWPLCNSGKIYMLESLSILGPIKGWHSYSDSCCHVCRNLNFHLTSPTFQLHINRACLNVSTCPFKTLILTLCLTLQSKLCGDICINVSLRTCIVQKCIDLDWPIAIFQYDWHCAKCYEICQSNVVRCHCGLLHWLIPSVPKVICLLDVRFDAFTSTQCCPYCSDQSSFNSVSWGDWCSNLWYSALHQVLPHWRLLGHFLTECPSSKQR